MCPKVTIFYKYEDINQSTPINNHFLIIHLHEKLNKQLRNKNKSNTKMDLDTPVTFGHVHCSKLT